MNLTDIPARPRMTDQQQRRPWLWLAWLAAFLVVEVPGALRDRLRWVNWITLSETFRRWCPNRWRFLTFAQLSIVLPIHLYNQTLAAEGLQQHWWGDWKLIAASGAIFAGNVLYAELWERRGAVGLRDLFGDVKKLIALKQGRDRIREAAKMGKLKATLWALGGAIGTSAGLQFTGACPSILPALPMLGMTFVGSVFAYLSARPLSKAGQKVVGWGLAGGALVAGAAKVGEQLNVMCGPDFTKRIPAIAFAGAWIGFMLWLRPDKAPKDLGSVTPPALKG